MAGGGLDGVDRLHTTINQATADLADLTTDVGPEAGQLLVRTGAKAAPRRTGKLAQRHGWDLVAGAVVVTAATRYAAAVHAHNPWLARTLDQHQDDIERLYIQGIDDALAQIKGT